VARHIQARTGVTIVNDVAGFIGPEVFRPPSVAPRLPGSVVMAKLHG
jgi:hypothetical protein